MPSLRAVYGIDGKIEVMSYRPQLPQDIRKAMEEVPPPAIDQNISDRFVDPLEFWETVSPIAGKSWNDLNFASFEDNRHAVVYLYDINFWHYFGALLFYSLVEGVEDSEALAYVAIGMGNHGVDDRTSNPYFSEVVTKQTDLIQLHLFEEYLQSAPKKMDEDLISNARDFIRFHRKQLQKA